MGRRSRKRAGGPAQHAGRIRPEAPGESSEVATRAPEPHARPRARKAPLEEAPKPPWAPVPLTEICIFVGLVVLGVAILRGGGSRGVLLAFGLALVMVATLELALREHLAGYRSHSALLAGLCAMLAAVPLAIIVRPAKAVDVIVAAVVFLAAFLAFRDLFRRRAGGMSWRA
ncbi:MAG TPA: hypothetical protein VMT10_11275 [Solirubrobacteraceae bacterium]|nr:hypothetical protein [Solirubrobacteraceae bacterium]